MCSCRFAWQTWHFVTFDVFQEDCVCATVMRLTLACLWRKPHKRVFLDVSEDVLMSFCVAGVCDIRCVSGGLCVRDRREPNVGGSLEEATQTCLSRRVRRCAHVVLRGRRGTLWHSMCFRRTVCVCATIVAEKLPCQWGKPHKRVFLDVPEDVLMSICVAGLALCDIRCVSGGLCVRHRREGKVGVAMGEATKTCLSQRVRRCAHALLRGRCGILWHFRRETKVAVSTGEATQTCLSRRVRQCAHVVLCGRRGTLWHSMCFRRTVCARPSWD